MRVRLWVDTFGTARGVTRAGGSPSPSPCALPSTPCNDDDGIPGGCCELLAVVGRNKVPPLLIVVEEEVVVSWVVEDEEDDMA